MAFSLDSLSPARLYPQSAAGFHPFNLPMRLMGLPASVRQATVAPTPTDATPPGAQSSLKQKMVASASALSQSPLAHGLLAPATFILTGGAAPLILTGALGVAALVSGTGVRSAQAPEVPRTPLQKIGHAVLQYGLGGCLFEGLGVAVGRYGAALRQAPDASGLRKAAGFAIEAAFYTLALAAGLFGLAPRMVIAAAVATFLLIQGTILAGTGAIVGAATNRGAQNTPAADPAGAGHGLAAGVYGVLQSAYQGAVHQTARAYHGVFGAAKPARPDVHVGATGAGEAAAV